MATNHPPCDRLEEEDYIDMDISSTVDMDSCSSTTFHCYTVAFRPHPKEFEFQMSANPTEREATTSPADELFYKGKLLPLHLPPRLQMIKKLLENSKHGFIEKVVSTPTTTSTTRSAPCQSCNISPASSCCVSGELNLEGYFACSGGNAISNQKKSWSRKLKLIKQSSLCLKLKASQDYLKCLFIKSRCSDECSSGYMKAAKMNPFGQIQIRRHALEDTIVTSLRSTEREQLMEEGLIHRKSFSGAISRDLTTKLSSGTSSCSSSLSSSFSSPSLFGLYQPQMLKRSSSMNSEMESSIQGAIAYCKESQQLAYGRKKIASDVGFYSLPTSRIAAACESQERPRLCRG